MTDRLSIPPGLEAQRDLGPAWGAWLDRLTKLAVQLLAEWELEVDGEPAHGACSLVLPVRSGALAAMLKVSFDGDDESAFEALALQVWGGNGAVRMIRADPSRRALLIERLHDRDLGDLDDEAAARVVGGLYARIHRPAPPQLRTVTSYVERWAEPLTRLPRDAPIPRRLVDQAVRLARDLVADPASVGRLVHGDLHQHNVLAGDREPWLVIDPKPMSGDPHYEPAPMLWNLWDRVTGSGDVRGSVRFRFHTLVDVAGLDEQRARDWVVLRMVINAHWTVAAAQAGSRGLRPGERDWVTRCLTIAKAVQD